MAADVLTPFIANSLGAMILALQDKWFLVFYEEYFQLPVQSYCLEIIENANIYLYVS